jgi:hypothetical protein
MYARNCLPRFWERGWQPKRVGPFNELQPVSYMMHAERIAKIYTSFEIALLQLYTRPGSFAQYR